MDTKETIQVLKNQGYRITPVRETMVSIIMKNAKPLSAIDILDILHKKGLEVNKTTVYRELEFLLTKECIKEVHVSPGVIHYESNYLPHHHHLTCTNCGSIKEVESDDIEEEMAKLTKNISSSGFQIKKHNLEFYGVCVNCQ